MPTLKNVFMFSGQGSQYFHMGRALYEAKPVYRDWMHRMDAKARELTHYSVLEALYSPERTKADLFDRTLFSHPAIFMTEIALAETLIDEGIAPDMVLGSSLGSFAAAVIAGCMDVEQGLSAVIKHAQIAEKYCAPGVMLAVFADPSIMQREPLLGRSELASHSAASQFVLAAPSEHVADIEAYLCQTEVPYQRLPVSFAFHSRWVDSAGPAYQALHRTLPIRRPDIPVACCVFAEIFTELPANYFWRIGREQIRLAETIRNLEKQGNYQYIDIGPSGSLTTSLKYLLGSQTRSRGRAICTPFARDVQNLEQLVASNTRAATSVDFA